MFFSNTQLTAPFYSILFETSIWQFNSSTCSPIMPDEFREHLTRSETIPSSRITPDPLDSPLHDGASSVHLTHVLQGSGQRTGMVIAEAWFCAQWPILCCFWGLCLDYCTVGRSKYGPIIRFLKESVTYLLFICLYLIDFMMPCV